MPVDSRHRVSLPPRTTIFSYHSSDDPIETGFQTVNYWDHYSSITDRINPVKFGTAGHRAPGPCVHHKCDVRGIIHSTSFVEANGGALVSVKGETELYLQDLYPDYSPSRSLTFPGWLNLLSRIEDSPTYANLCVSAFNKQITQVPAKTSIINFGIELLELRPIFKKLGEIPNHIRQGSLSKAVSGKRISRLTPARIAKSGAKGFLAAEFQWLPFISDIAAFTGTIDAVTKRLNYLRKTKGKEATVRFSSEDCYSRPLGDILVINDGRNSTETIRLDRYQCDFVSTWKLFQDLEGLDDAWAELRATFAYLGVNNPAKIIWNAIPFSFLVDWVTPVSKWLERAAVQPFYGEWNVYDVTSSLRENYTFSFNSLFKHGGSSGPRFYVDVDNYRRLNYLPLTLGAIDFTQLTDTQQKLAAALVISQGGRH